MSSEQIEDVIVDALGNGHQLIEDDEPDEERRPARMRRRARRDLEFRAEVPSHIQKGEKPDRTDDPVRNVSSARCGSVELLYVAKGEIGQSLQAG